MTFISHEDSREAQRVRNSVRDKKGRAVGKFTTPDRPETNLAYSLTGKAPGKVRGDMAAALEAAGLAPERRPGRKPKGKRRPQSRKPQSAANAGRNAASNVRRAGMSSKAAAEAMRRMAKAAKPSPEQK